MIEEENDEWLMDKEERELINPNVNLPTNSNSSYAYQKLTPHQNIGVHSNNCMRF